MESSPRKRTLEGLEFLRSEFGQYPRLFCNHGQNRENLYWGSKRFRTSALRALSRVLMRDAAGAYEGDEEGSRFFWGDICHDVIQYVRNFTFERLNLLQVDPGTPYRIESTPYVRYWFSTTDAPDVQAFNRVLSPERIDELVAADGVCIVSTHFGKGFVEKGRVNRQAASSLKLLADKAGWLVPVSEVLDHLRETGRGRTLTRAEALRLELRFVASRLRQRQSTPV